MKTYPDIKPAATIDAVIPYVEALFDIRSPPTPKRISWCMSIKRMVKQYIEKFYSSSIKHALENQGVGNKQSMEDYHE